MKGIKVGYRMLSLAMTLIVILSVCGCGKNTGESSLGTSEYDLKGRTVVLGGYANMAPDEASNTYIQEQQLLEDIEKKYNCKLDFTYTNDWATWIDTIKMTALSGQKVADAFCATIDYILPTWVSNEMLVPLDDYIDLENEAWNKDTVDFWKMGDKHYTVSTGKHYLGYCILFNKRICASYGITDQQLYDLQKNGEWTWDKLLELTKQCTKDTDNDGKTDVWGFGAYGCAPISAESFIFSNGSSCVTLDENFKYQYNLTDPAAIEAIEFCRMMANDAGVCYKGDYDWGTWEKLWNRGKVAFYQVPSWEMDAYYENLKDDEFGILLIPKGPKAEGYVNAENIADGWFMQPQVEDKETIGAILTDWLYPYEWREDDSAWKLASAKVFDDGSLDAYKMIEECSTPALGEIATWFRDNVLWNDFGVNTNMAGRTYAETYQAASQQAFDELLFDLQNSTAEDTTSTESESK